MKTFQLIALCFTSYVCNAQLVEHFNDGNFTDHPVWLGSQAQFIINGNQEMQLNNTVAGTSYLSTAFAASSMDGFEWEAYVKQSFAPSSSNFGRIYLVSDHENLSGPLNGYYLQLGEAGSNDAVELFRQAGNVHTSVCRATNAGIAASFSIRVKVTRSSNAVWSLFIDYSGGTDFVEAAHGTDATFTASSHFGVFCLYTAGNANKFFFDDLIAGPPLGDVTPPQFTGIQVPSDSTLLLSFSETLDSVVSNSLSRYRVSDSIGQPIAITDNNDGSQLVLRFQHQFVNGKQYHIDVDSVADPSGNWSEPVSRFIRHFIPMPATERDIVFNELYPDPSPTLGLPAQEFLELFNASKKAFNLEGWRISDLTSTTILPSVFLLPGEYLIVTSTAGLPNYSPYGMTLGLSEMPTLNNTSDTFVLRDSAGTRIDSVHYTLAWYGDDDHALGGYSLERLQPTATSNQPLNWTASLDSIGGTPGRRNSVMGNKLDTRPPHIDSLIVTNDHELRLYFDEPVDSLLLSVQNSYSIESSRENPSEVFVAARSVGLSFTSRFTNGAEDHLLINHVVDTAGNAIDSLRLTFRYFVPGVPGSGSVVINEIMADPAPVEYLPEAEFIEIVNRDTVPFDLKGWTLSDATSTAILPSAAILPGEFIILTASSSVLKFLGMGRVVGFSGFPSLNNSGEPLTLRSPSGQIIDSLRYDVHWIEDDPKRDGGWSLERLLYDYPSTSSLNWRPSRDSLGGSPGKINSIVGDKLDAIPPTLDSLVVLSDHALRLVFSEPMDSTSLSVLSRYSASAVYPSSATVSARSVTLAFSLSFGNGHSNILLVDSVSDASANFLAQTATPFRYFVPANSLPGDVVINEIMADPAPVVHLPEAEYIEIFNRTPEPFDLTGWSVKDATSIASLPPAVILPNEFIILTNSTNATKFSEDRHVIGVAGFPSLNNSGEPLVIRNAEGVVIDSVLFQIDWFEDDPKEDGGWSLERLVYDYSSTSGLNWRPSRDSAGGSPGRINSIVGDKLDARPPVVESLIVLSDFKLRVVFNEQMDSTSLSQLSRYSVLGVNPVEIAVKETSATLTFSIPFGNGHSNTLLVDSVSDASANMLAQTILPFRYFIPGDPQPGDVVISEIMADPVPVVQLPEAEYIEIFNNTTEPFDLSGWSITDATSTAFLPASIILPFEFIILTNTSNASKYSESGHVVGVVGFPSLNNTGEPLVFRSADSTIIDSVRFDIDWFENDPKRDGGWSLERLLYDYSSTSGLNWRPSRDSAGGTPGWVNSIVGDKLDSKAPAIDSLVVLSNVSLQLHFNEPMDSSSLSRVSGYSVSGVYPATVTAEEISVTLAFSIPFGNGYSNTLVVDSISDASGNMLSQTVLPFRYFLPGIPQPGDVVINEIMADPVPVVHLPEAEYIEIFNTTAEPFDLTGWTIADATSTALLSVSIILPHELIVLTNTSNASRFSEQARVIGVTGFPSLNNAGEPLVLRSSDSTVIDSVYFHIDWFEGDQKREGGWSLERLLYDYTSTFASNWRPALDSSGGTPGMPNSVLGEKLDAKPPLIDSLIVLTENSLRVFFSEPMDSVSVNDLSSYHLSTTDETPFSANQQENTVELKFSKAFINGVDNVLLVDSVKDIADNVLTHAELPFMYFIPGRPSAGDVVFNEIMSDPAPVVHLPEAEYVEIYNRTDKPFDLKGWTLSDATTSVSLPKAIILPGEFVILTSTSGAQKFAAEVKTIGVPGFPSLSNSGEPLALHSADSTLIDSLRYDPAWIADEMKKDGGWSLERLLYDYSSLLMLNWRVAIDTAGGTPGGLNSILGQKLDEVSPGVDSVVTVNSRTVRLYFSEPLDTASLHAGVYTIEGFDGRPLAAISGDTAVTLTYEHSFENGVEYFIWIEGVVDVAGNKVNRQRFPVTYFVPGVVKPGVILINEIMADPSPVVGLPETEYVEIVNHSAEPFDLHGWSLSDSTHDAHIPSHVILPGKHLILTSTSSATKFDSANTLGVPGFPSLSNSGEPLMIYGPDHRLIDSVRYDLSWFDDSFKEDGGWSLERLLLDHASTDPANWRPSIDLSGGTPGRINSINGKPLDDTPPTIDSVSVISAHRIVIYFNERIDSIALKPLGKFLIDGSNDRPIDLDSEGSRVTIVFSKAFVNGDQYFLLVSGVADLAGNAMQPMRLPITWFIPGIVNAGVVVITEIMADPSPSVHLPDAEYIEIANRTTSPFDLHGWRLSDASTSAVLPARIIRPGEFVVLTSSTNASKFGSDGVLAVPGFPSLSNAGEPLTLTTAEGLVVDSVAYNATWCAGDEKCDGGWSIERVKLDFNSNSALNWRVSQDSSGGTPARQNSVVDQRLDVVAPTIDSVVVISERSLGIYFSEPMNTSTLQLSENYFIEEDKSHPIAITTSPGAAILEFESAFINGQEYVITVQAVTDTAGNAIVPARLKFRRFTPAEIKPGAVLINEIMADPTPVVQLAEAEFVEIVNPGSAPIDLQGWTLSDATSTAVLPQAIIMPGEFLILTSTSSKQKFEGKVLGVAGFPSLNNLGEPLAIRDPAGVTIDSVHYDIQFYGSDSKADGGWTLERLRYEFNSNWILNWKPSSDSRGGTPGTVNSHFGEHPDQAGPHIVNARVIDQHVIEILFDEPVVAPTVAHAVTIDSVECADVVTDGSLARFSFDRAFINGLDYDLHVEGIRDSVGNLITAVEIVVSYFEPAAVSYRDVIITEIMADPSPVIGLPEAEYIEILNRSINPINLAGWSLIDANNAAYLSRSIVMPGEYIVIASASSAGKFTLLNVLGINAFPSLSNDGEPLVLRDPSGLLIDSVSYNANWYRSDDKSDGGWSLELIDLENPCAGEDNWTASEAIEGGTPGSINSVNANKPDVSGPKLLAVEADATTLSLHFNERLEKRLVYSTVELTPSAGAYTMRFADRSLRTVILQFAEELKVSTEYQVTVQNVFDCNGNEIDSQFNSAGFAIPEAPQQGDVVINEILFDPRSSGVDFVEVYNAGSRYVDLSGWTLSGQTRTDRENIPDGVLLKPQTYAVFTSDPVTLKSHYPQGIEKTFVETDTPSLPDDEGAVVLHDKENLLIDSVHYSNRMHSQMLRDAEGVSLERVSSMSRSDDPANWTSANESAGFATPGYVNSGSRSIHNDSEAVVLVTPEVLSFQAAETFVLIQYNLEEPGFYVNCRIHDLQGREVREIAQNASVGSQGFFRWDGDDDSGRRVLPGYYLVLFEYFNMNGQVQVSRSRVVVAPR